jgi:choline dehydrogenase
MQSDFAKTAADNQRHLASQLGSGFDYVVCGAGTSGCVVAARLAADPAISVLLLEAGRSDDTDLISNPNVWPMTLGSELDWGFVAEPNARLNGRAVRYSMGRVLGGGSSINVSTWSRGHRSDCDFSSAEAGDAARGYHTVLDLYRRRIEAWRSQTLYQVSGFAKWLPITVMRCVTGVT